MIAAAAAAAAAVVLVLGEAELGVALEARRDADEAVVVRLAALLRPVGERARPGFEREDEGARILTSPVSRQSARSKPLQSKPFELHLPILDRRGL